MSLPRFIQIHTLHTYPAALLNRDDAGLAKRLPYGGAVRTRISSQCLKRHWRVADDAFALATIGVPMSVRSRVFAERIAEAIKSEGVAPDISDAVAAALRDALKKDLSKLIKEAGKSKPKKKAKVSDDAEEESAESEPDDDVEQKQAILLGWEEYHYLESLCRDVGRGATDAASARLVLLQRLKEEQGNFKQMTKGCGLEAALFGRMVTSDLLAQRDASISVAHAFTVHGAEVENDYFTVVDDLTKDEGGLGSAGIFDTELASGLYYGYVVIDVPQLVANLEGIAAKDVFASSTEAAQRELAGKVTQHLLHLIATVSPGAKRGSTAPYDWAKFVLVEAGDWQPRSLAAAFHDPLPLKGEATIRARAAGKLSSEIAAFDAAYGMPTVRRFLSLDELTVPAAERATLAQLGEWVAQIIRDGAC